MTTVSVKPVVTSPKVASRLSAVVGQVSRRVDGLGMRVGLPSGVAPRVVTLGLALAPMVQVYQFVKPWILGVIGGGGYNLGGDCPRGGANNPAVKQRRNQLFNHVVREYVLKGDHKIDWREVADICDTVAQANTNDRDFRLDLWYLFGWTNHGTTRSLLARFLDHTNRFLPQRFKNTDMHGRELYRDSQVHHYLGAVTGNTDKVPYHMLNNPLYNFRYELGELQKRGQFNWGDWKLSNRAIRDRDDFLMNGRSRVGANIRRLITQG